MGSVRTVPGQPARMVPRARRQLVTNQSCVQMAALQRLRKERQERIKSALKRRGSVAMGLNLVNPSHLVRPKLIKEDLSAARQMLNARKTQFSFCLLIKLIEILVQ